MRVVCQFAVDERTGINLTVIGSVTGSRSRRGSPLGRLGEAADVAGAVRFLCADESSFVTGAFGQVDGGLGM